MGKTPSIADRKRLKLAACAARPRQAARVARLSAVARRAVANELSDLWCILRTSPGRTISLAASLNEAGIKAWTPQQTIKRKRPRSSTIVERQLALAPTFVFAEAARLADLARIHGLPLSQHPTFSIFHDAGLVPLISDKEVAGFRAAEERARREREREERAKLDPPRFATGLSVQTEDPPAFAGLVGTVEGQNQRDVVICFGGLFGRVHVDAWQVLPAPL